MAAVGTPSELPNLKIEIENFIDEAMETDDGENQSDSKLSKDDIEEGEISDAKDTEPNNASDIGSDLTTVHSIWDKRYENKSGDFVTGEDFFGEEQSKLDERAKRFGLDPIEVKSVSDKEFKRLYQSLGIKPEDGSAEKHYRLNALHMRGTEEMSTQDIFAYFKDYCAASIEWINDYTCNVVWLDEPSAARALLGLSKQIKGLKTSIEKGNPFSKDYKNEDTKEDQKIGETVNSKDTENVMVVDDSQDKEGDSGEESDEVKDNTVHVSEITSPIPPGLWRKGIEHPKSKCILLRFASRTDRKPPGSEKMSDYYKKHGNPNYGGIKGLITSSRKRRYRKTDIPPKIINFEDDLGDGQEYRDAGKIEDSKNPWGNLAKSWSNIDKNRGKKKPAEPYYADSPPRRMTPPPSPQMDFVKSRSILKRLGTLDGMSRIHRTTHNSEEESVSSCEDDLEWTRRSKVPRMRMYADEEEMRMVRRKGVASGASQKESVETWKDPKLDERDVRHNRDRETSEHVSRSRVRNSEDLRSRLERDRRGHSGQRGTRSWMVPTKLGRRTASPKAQSKLEDLESESESESIEENLEDEGFSARITDLRSTLNSGKKQRVEFQAEDLRSKLNKKKTMKHLTRQKSPLRIEIDNDEYYRLIGSDHE